MFSSTLVYLFVS